MSKLLNYYKNKKIIFKNTGSLWNEKPALENMKKQVLLVCYDLNHKDHCREK